MYIFSVGLTGFTCFNTSLCAKEKRITPIGVHKKSDLNVFLIIVSLGENNDDAGKISPSAVVSGLHFCFVKFLSVK